MNRWLFAVFLTCIANAFAQQGATCSKLKPCELGCCSKSGSCGFTPEHCGEGCQSNCDAKAECGQYSVGNVGCPLNVCCSPFGFCGTSSAFCGDGCQKGCEPVYEPQCEESTDIMNLRRRVGYFEMFHLDQRKCDRFLPEHIAGGALTHVNLAFALISKDFKITGNHPDIVARGAHLKDRFTGLRVNIAIGGWAFNNPPTANIWSNMVASYEYTQTFLDSLVDYLTKFGLDGVDLDWEYPVATDRGGSPEDFENYVVFVARMRERFDKENPGWEISMTLPSSYWYLRGFDIKALQEYVTYFNMMTYDLHGIWDKFNEYTGPYLKGQTNLTEIDMGLDLLWRNDISPDKVVMGFAFYGRSFTMADATCHDPNAGCQFTTTGRAGDCSATAGILIYPEIESRNQSANAQTYYDSKSTVKYTVYDYDQWVSYDDEQSFTDKKRYLNKRCLSGLMIWAVDQDTQNYNAMNGLFGSAAMESSLLHGNDLTDAQKEKLSSQLAAYTGQNCFVTPLCTDGSEAESDPRQVCPAGTSSVTTAHAPLQFPGQHGLIGQCSPGWYRHICCPSDAMPENCKWVGEPVRQIIGCYGKCGSNEFELATDSFADPLGHDVCFQGHRSLCCDSTEILDQCFWSGCQGPLEPPQHIGLIGTPGCPDGYESVASRFDTDDGGWCSSLFDSSLHDRFKRGFCCPKNDKSYFRTCHWTSQSTMDSVDGQLVYDPSRMCVPRKCHKTKTKVTEALEPAPLNPNLGCHTLYEACTVGDYCDKYPILPEYSPEFYLCCDPPSVYDERWPVPPHYLWENAYEDEEDDVAWTIAEDYGNNNQATNDDPIGDNDPSGHAYGFLMLDGPPQSIDSTFGESYTFVRRSSKIPRRRRSLITTNTTVLDSTFDHANETVYVFCNHPDGSSECDKVFYQGAKDTVISLPEHVGEGPYARVVSMTPAPDEYELPHHHVRTRSTEQNHNTVYKLTFDYDFHLIKRDDGPINMRIDYTNLLPYWDDVTDSPASRKRSMSDRMSQEDWKSIIEEAKKQAPIPKSHSASSVTDMVEIPDPGLRKRWFGKFLGWLKKVTHVKVDNDGFLTMGHQESFLLYNATKGCQGSIGRAEMRMYLDADVEMDATYAYYLSGTIAPLQVIDTYGYLGVEPSAYLGLRLEADAVFKYTSPWKKLVDTLAYPGLSIKGIATVGPSLDIYGRIRGHVTLSGQAKAGAKLHFGRAELYFPQGKDIDEKYDKIKDIQAKQQRPTQGLEPQFSASAQAEAKLFVDVSPNAKIGINVGPSVLGKGNLVDAQILAFVNSTLEFSASASALAGTKSDPTVTYTYGAYFYYNLGYGGFANILAGTWNWNYQPVFLYNPPGMRYPIYESDSLEPDPVPGLKRSMEGLQSHEEFPDWGQSANASLEPYAPPIQQLRHHRQLSQHRQHMSHHAHNVSLPEHSSDSWMAYNPDWAIYKRADTDTPMTDADAEFSLYNIFKCPPGGDSKEVRLPEFRYNCRNAFYSTQAVANKKSYTVYGICHNVASFFRERALAPETGIDLTYDSNEGRAQTRRRKNCPSTGRPCRQEQRSLVKKIGLPPSTRNLISCDEFPFAGCEEGGEFFSKYAQPKTPPAITCAPVWQQTLQGKCNSILGGLQTNLTFFDAESTQGMTEWKMSNEPNYWTPGASETAQNPPPLAKTTRAPTRVPRAHGIDVNEWENSGYTLTYKLQRRFRMALAYFFESDYTANDWGVNSWTYKIGNNHGAGTHETRSEVFCAVNLFNQPHIYRYPDYNGWCYQETSNLDDLIAFGRRPGYAQCKVNFRNSPFESQTAGATGAAGTAKREAIGRLGDWEIESIELNPNPEEFIPIPEGENAPVMGNLMPARWANLEG